MKSICVYLALVLVFVGCKNEKDNSLEELSLEAPVGWQKVNQGNKFCFYIPPDYSEIQVNPIDSVVRFFGNETSEFGYDYGWYSGKAEIGNVRVGGYEALLSDEESLSCSENFVSHKIYNLQFVSIGQGQTSLSMFTCVGLENEGLAKQIIGTVKFDEDCQ